MAKDVVLSVSADGWNVWGSRFVKRQPLARIQHLIAPNSSSDAAKRAVLGAIRAAGADGTVIINVGHGSIGGNANEGSFELAPSGAMKIVGLHVVGGFVDVFYDVNTGGPAGKSDLDYDLKENPSSQRLVRWKVYQEIATAFKTTGVREVILLTCRVGNATEFLRKVANDWGVVIRAYTKKVALSEVVSAGKSSFMMHLEDNPPPYATAADTILREQEIPFAPNDTFRVGPPL